MTAAKKSTRYYPPPWQDLPTLCEHISVSPNTIDTWVTQGILPPPRERGGKRLWKWSEVDEKLTVGAEGASPDSQAERIRNASRAAAEEGRVRQ
jgi:predicted DNA-binding transcriptional regulator AlpA